MAPPKLNVTKGSDGYSLSWEVQTMHLVPRKLTFEVQYKKDTASWEVRRVPWRAWAGRGVRQYTGGYSLQVPGFSW